MSATSRPGRKHEILIAFTRRVAAQGYDTTSLREIADEIGVSKGTIMHHFTSKDRILAQMSLGYMNRRLSELSLLKAAFPDPVDQLAGIITTLVTAFRDDADATRAFSREFIRFAGDSVMDEVRALRRTYIHEVEDIIAKGIADGTIATRSPRVTALQIVGMCNWSWTWIDPSGPTSVEDIAAIYTDGILSGLRTTSAARHRTSLPPSIVAARAAELL